MVELTSRQRDCLRYLLRQRSYVTAGELARHLGCSERTARTALDAIEAFCDELGARLSRIPGQGTRLEADDAARATLLEGLDASAKSLLSREERDALSETLLLLHPTMTFQQLADACNVSRQTAVSSGDALAAFFTRAALELDRERGQGLLLKGPELAFRRCFIGLVTGLGTRSVARTCALEGLRADCLDRAGALVSSIEDLQAAAFVDAEGIRLLLAYAIFRSSEGYVLSEGEPAYDRLTEAPEGTAMGELSALLAEEFSDPCELRFAASLVQAQRTSSPSRLHQPVADREDEAVLISHELIASIAELHVVDELALNHLIDGLTTHLRAAIYRCRNNIQVESELPDQILASISLLYEFTRRQMLAAGERHGIAFSESEIAYIAMYLDAIYESSAKNAVALNVLFVCPFGLASSSILMTRLSYALAECNVTGPLSEAQAQDYLASSSVDLVIATTDVDLDGATTLIVDPLLGQNEVEKVKSQIMQLSYSKMCSYFLRSFATTSQVANEERRIGDFIPAALVQVGVACDDWREAIRLASGPLLDRGLVEGRYVERMISAVEDFGPYMVLTPKCAYVHAGVNDGTLTNCASMLVLAHDIPFGPASRKQVRCIVVLGIHDTERSFLLALAPILEREENIAALEDPLLNVPRVLDMHD